MPTVEEAIFRYLIDFQIPASQVRADHRFNDDFGFDSFDMIELVIYLEETFEIDLMDCINPNGSQSIGEVLEMLRVRYGLA